MLLDKLRLLWARVTVSKFTAIYFALSVIHFAVQVVFQSQAFSINAQAADFINDLVSQGNATQPGFMVASNGQLHMCSVVPASINANDCQLMWQMDSSGNMAQSSTSAAPSTASHSSSSLSYHSLEMVSDIVSSAVLTSTAVPVSSVSSHVSSAVAPSSSAASKPASASSAVSSSAAVSKVASSAVSAPSASKGPVVTVTKVVTSGEATTQPAVSSSAAAVSPAKPVTPSSAAEAAKTARGVDTRNVVAARDFMIQELSMSNGTTVKVSGLPGVPGTVELDNECLTVLNWPVQVLEQTKREDLAFIMFQFWLLGMSLVALLNESIPHIIVSLLMHILATAWAGFQIADTAQFKSQFSDMTTESACNGVNLLPNYWQDRADAEIPSLALNAVALLASTWLSWRLMKAFGWQTFKRVGASLVVNRVYNAVLMLSITIQLAFFFIAVSGAIWIDQLFNTIIGHLATDAQLFKGVTITVIVLLVPWLTTGWIAVRRELNLPMLFFMLLSLLYLVGWSCMFISSTFRWLFVQWRFFSLVATASVLLALLALVLSVVCRLNFGKGLHRCLNAPRYAPGSDLATSNEKMDMEKAEFPSNEMPLPTFSGAFGSIADIPPSYGGPRRLAFNPNVPLYSPGAGTTPSRTNSVSSSSSGSRSDAPSLKRENSGSSSRSGRSERSPMPKRWVIE